MTSRRPPREHGDPNRSTLRGVDPISGRRDASSPRPQTAAASERQPSRQRMRRRRLSDDSSRDRGRGRTGDAARRRPTTAKRRHDVAPDAPKRKRRVRARQLATPRSGSSAPNHRFRFKAALAALALVVGYIFSVVVKLQTEGGDELRAQAAEQWTRTLSLPADRGSIFDRNGEELALSVPTATVSINPRLITDPDLVATTLQSVLSLTDEHTTKLRARMVAKDVGFVFVKRQVDLDLGRHLRKLKLSGVNIDPEDKRVLPGGFTGLSVIGRTDIDGEGIGGLELQYGGSPDVAEEKGYNVIMAGTPGEMTKQITSEGRSIPGTENVTKAPVPGSDLVLTIDRSIQYTAEQAILNRIDEIGAQSATAIVMDVKSGDVYAMASVDRDNKTGKAFVTSANLAAVNVYEPGSVAKVITLAASLNEGAVTPQSTFVVPWRRTYGEHVLSDAYQHGDDVMTVEQILVASSNIGTIDVQQAIGTERHWDYMRLFGLGEKTALNFPGESPGILKPANKLYGAERVTVSYGHGLASTSIQLATVVNTIANDGVYVAPRLVKAHVDPSGNVVEAEPSATHEVITPKTAQQMQDIMRQVVCRGTAKRAQNGIENFSVAGKTGTGLKAQGKGYLNARGERSYYASFVGFFPAEDPQVTVLISVDEPPAGENNRFGGTAAAPVFAEIAPQIVQELGITPPENTKACG